jgi:TPR repeat protein
MISVKEGVDYYDNSKFEEAYNALIEYAKNGNDEAQYIIGLLYYHGNYVDKNLEEAIVWFKQAARRRNLEAMSLLMECDSTTTSHTNRF